MTESVRRTSPQAASNASDGLPITQTALATLGARPAQLRAYTKAAVVSIMLMGTVTGSTIEETATASYDANGDSANEASADSLASFTVLSPASLSAPVKSVSGPTHPGATVTYTIVLSNSGAAPQLDNPGDELVDVLPAGLTLTMASGAEPAA